MSSLFDAFVNQIIKMIEFGLKKLKISKLLKDTVKWSETKRVLGYLSCSLSKNLCLSSKNKGNRGMVNISWDGETVLKANVIPFLKNPENVISVNDVTFLHDKAPCMKARATQMLLRSEDIDFWGNDIWPGNSPDLNAAEHIGAIIKDEVETRIIADVGPNRYSYETLKAHVEEVLKSLENRTDLFEQLLLSYPNRLEAVRQANGGHTDY